MSSAVAACANAGLAVRTVQASRVFEKREIIGTPREGVEASLECEVRANLGQQMVP
jgi:hypothetical protein